MLGDIRANHLNPRPVNGCFATLPATAPEREHPRSLSADRDFVGETRLAHSGLAEKHEETATPGDRVLEARFELRELAVPADEHASRGGSVFQANSRSRGEGQGEGHLCR